METLEIRPIAYFRSPFTSKFGIPRQSGIVKELRGEIHFAEGFRRSEALRGLEDFDMLWLIWGFSANRETSSGDWQATVRPPRLGGNRSLGVFATRSPYRPNPLGLSSVRIERIDPDGPVIHVLGADLMDGTPIYDIKPYISYTDAHPNARSGFVDKVGWQTLEVEIPEDICDALGDILSETQVDTLKEVLALDPRPHYHDDPEKSYGMPYEGLDIHFRVSEGRLRVISFDSSPKKG